MIWFLCVNSEQMEERLSNSSSVSSPTLDDILDSLLALRRPNKKIKSRGGTTTSTTTLMKGKVILAYPLYHYTSHSQKHDLDCSHFKVVPKKR